MKQLYREVITMDLGEAAFYTSFGYLPEYIYGKTSVDTKMRFQIPMWFLWYKKNIGYVRYKSLLGWRQNLKNNIRQHYGLPLHYTSSKTGFKLMDVARVTYEKER